jgi:hypothetical protein
MDKLWSHIVVLLLGFGISATFWIQEEGKTDGVDSQLRLAMLITCGEERHAL